MDGMGLSFVRFYTKRPTFWITPSFGSVENFLQSSRQTYSGRSYAASS